MNYTKENWTKHKKSFIAPFNKEFMRFNSKGFVKEIEPYVLTLEKEHSQMYQTLIMAMSVIIKHGSPELVEKYKLIINEIEK